jgi:hypothetical protein
VDVVGVGGVGCWAGARMGARRAAARRRVWGVKGPRGMGVSRL